MQKIRNCTQNGDFILLGFTNHHHLENIIFPLLVCIYSLTILGNMIIIIITMVDAQLDTPMYFFLRHFAVLEIGFTTTIVPKTLVNMTMGRKTISFAGCFLQGFLYFVLATTEFFLLAVMSVDRYVAICNPLRYTVIMNSQICSLLVLCSWMWGLLLITGPTIALIQLPFCGPNIVDHFFCDGGPVMKLANADTRLLELIDFLIAILSLLGTLAVNVFSYMNIFPTIMRIPTANGRKKAFSTCVFHIIVVSITYGSCIFLYVKPNGTTHLDFRKPVAVLNTIVSPLLNPFIYSLRNNQVHEALRTTFRKLSIRCKLPSAEK